MSAEEPRALTHVDAGGRAHMVDVASKPDTIRRATATGHITMARHAFDLAVAESGPKGSVTAVAELAGVMAAKRTADLIPLCHSIVLSSVRVRVEPCRAMTALVATAEVRANGPTGVEMEALVAVSAALLTVYDMLKAVDRSMTLGAVRVIEKQGGRTGHYVADTQ
jgi:cyclic pyranopterin monophosphate synthase